MKIIHTSDWHIGKIVNERSMIEDQEYILKQLMEEVVTLKPDVMLIAGDIYDRSIPPIEAVELLDHVLHTLINTHKIKVLIISGNHDSGGRIGFGSRILRKQGLYMAGDEKTLYEKVVIDEAGECVHFYLIPYKDPAVVRKLLEDKTIRTHQEAMQAIMNEIRKEVDETVPNVVVAHGYVMQGKSESAVNPTVNKIENPIENAIENAIAEDVYTKAHLETSESERPLAIGGTDLIDHHVFDGMDYVALGHLHGRQYVGRESIRYSGSLLRYSFSEVKQIKGITEVDIQKDKTVTVNQHELVPKRAMRIIEGTLEELIEKGRAGGVACEDYLQAILKDEGELISPMDQLRAVYPNMMSLLRKQIRVIDESQTSAKSGYKTKSELDLFGEFYEVLGQGSFDEAKKAVITEVMTQVLREESEQ